MAVARFVGWEGGRGRTSHRWDDVGLKMVEVYGTVFFQGLYLISGGSVIDGGQSTYPRTCIDDGGSSWVAMAEMGTRALHAVAASWFHFLLRGISKLVT